MILKVYKVNGIGEVGIAADGSLFISGDTDEHGQKWHVANFGLKCDFGRCLNTIHLKKHPNENCLIHAES